MNETITYSAMRTAIEAKDRYGRPIPFSAKCVKANRLKGVAGGIASFDAAIKYSDLRYLSTGKSGFRPKITIPKKVIRDPNHYKNNTTNFAHLVKDELLNVWVHNGVVEKIHYRLIIEFNGKEVIWD